MNIRFQVNRLIEYYRKNGILRTFIKKKMRIIKYG